MRAGYMRTMTAVIRACTVRRLHSNHDDGARVAHHSHSNPISDACSWRAPRAGCVRIMTTGASPISAEVMDFLRCAFGATVVEGYGMTESACTISMTHPAETSSGHVGGPLPCCEVKID